MVINFSVTSIGEQAFYDKRNIKTIKLPNSVTSISRLAFFACSGLTSINIPKRITTINEYTFQKCTALQSIEIPDNVKSIEREAFSECTSLISIELPKGLKSIGVEAFRGCKGLKSVEIPNSVENIERAAFGGTNLNTFIIGSGTKTIGSYVLSTAKDVYCYALALPVVNGVIMDLTEEKKSTLHVPSVSLSAYKSTYPWSKFGSIVSIPVSVEAIALASHELTCNVGSQNSFTYTIIPNDADDQSVIWSSSNDEIITINKDGEMTALKQGEAWVKVTSESNPEAKDSCFVTVIQTIKDISLNYNEYTLNRIGQTVQLEATIVPSDATNKTVTWSSSNEKVCVVENGLVTAKSTGTATITVRTEEGGHTASCVITVEAARPVTGITLNYETYTLNNIGDGVQLVATVHPEDADNKAITWSSMDESVCKVLDGYVLAVGEGTTIVTATTVDGGFTARCVVTVRVSKPVTGVTLDKNNVTLHSIGEGLQLKATVLPENADNKNVTWVTSNNAVCTVSEVGYITAVGEGVATITVRTEDGGYTASCTITVEVAHPVTGIQLNYSSYEMECIGATLQLEAIIQPEDAKNKKVAWDSMDQSICRVQNGLVLAVGCGTTIVTATTEDGGYTAHCVITVKQPVTGILLNYAEYTLGGIGQSIQLAATIIPENASNKEIVWKSYNESICIVSNGIVVGVGYGTTVVSATAADGGHMATCTITVEDRTPVNSIEADAVTYKIYSVEGVRIPYLQKGFNILRFKDGTIRKVFVK